MALTPIDQAVHLLALKLGKTAEEVREGMLWEELQDWLSYFADDTEPRYLTDDELFNG